MLEAAGLLPAPAGAFLRAADAIHIAAALKLQATSFLTYDRSQAQAAVAAGLVVSSPGQ